MHDSCTSSCSSFGRLTFSTSELGVRDAGWILLGTEVDQDITGRPKLPYECFRLPQTVLTSFIVWTYHVLVFVLLNPSRPHLAARASLWSSDTTLFCSSFYPLAPLQTPLPLPCLLCHEMCSSVLYSFSLFTALTHFIPVLSTLAHCLASAKYSVNICSLSDWPLKLLLCCVHDKKYTWSYKTASS